MLRGLPLPHSRTNSGEGGSRYKAGGSETTSRMGSLHPALQTLPRLGRSGTVQIKEMRWEKAAPSQKV